MKSTSKEAYALAGIDINLADKVKGTVARQVRSTFRCGILSRLVDLLLRGNTTQYTFMKIQILCGI